MQPNDHPALAELTPYPFQRVGAQWLTQNDTALLADSMGLGKSVQFIRAADALELRRILLTVPTVALWNWHREFTRHSLYKRRVQVISKGSRGPHPDADVVVTTHGLLRNPRLAWALSRQTWDLVGADEADVFKNLGAKCTRAFYGMDANREPGSIASLARRVWLLSGTPARNSAEELWTHVHALRPESIRVDGVVLPLDAYLHRYCIVRQSSFGPKVIGNRKNMLDELRERVVRPFTLRRTIPQVLPELPPVRFDLLPVACDHVPDELRRLGDEIGPALEAYLSLEDDEIDPLTALNKLRIQELGAKPGETRMGGFSRLRRLTGALKIAPAVEVIRTVLAEEDKIIVGAWHTDTVEALVAACAEWNPVKIRGETVPKARQDAVDRFQTDPRCRVFVGQIQACATAITLTAAREVLLVESSWVPRDNQQFAARAHRIGQNRAVRVQVLALEGSVDTVVHDALVRKTRVVRELFE